MNSPAHCALSTFRISSIIAASALAFGLTACDRTRDTVGQTPKAVDQTAPINGGISENNAPSMPATSASGSFSAAASDAGKAVSGVIDDAAITAKIKAELAKDADLSAMRIDVDTRNGAVTLTGPAKSEHARERAETLARGIEGVVSVANNLTVSPS